MSARECIGPGRHDTGIGEHRNPTGREDDKDEG